MTYTTSTTRTKATYYNLPGIEGMDKDEGPSAGSDRGLKKQKTSKDAEPTISPKTKDSSPRSFKGTKSQPKSFGKFIHEKEPEFKVGDTNTPQDQEGNQEPTDPDWNKDKTPQKGPTQNLLMTLVASTSNVFRFNDRVIALEKDVAELKNDSLHIQATICVFLLYPLVKDNLLVLYGVNDDLQNLAKVLIGNKFLLPRQFNGSSYGQHKLRNQFWDMVAYKGEKDLVCELMLPNRSISAVRECLSAAREIYAAPNFGPNFG
nr:hypothetical protein [Tanacetum cinerariifolium]